MKQKDCAVMRHERMLVATDGSKHSAAALDQAIGLAKACQCKLFILHAIDMNPEYLAISPKLEELMEKDAALILEKAKKKATEAGIVCETILDIADPPYKAIVQTAKKQKIDLIVMGTHGKNALAKLVMGSVTRQVIGHIPCAVMVVPV
ncbi:MAG: universal stress protein [Proteobacteria bacterium]|nr:universal stress protein [Pseudomonadota bacterium]MBU1717032.1 universal stress protein [Pseudomonadota bacterium]